MDLSRSKALWLSWREYLVDVLITAVLAFAGGGILVALVSAVIVWVYSRGLP